MTRLGLALLAIALLSAVALLVASRRRRRQVAEIRVDPRPAGMKQLARHVGALSSFGMGLRLPPPQGGARRPTGNLISVR